MILIDSAAGSNALPKIFPQELVIVASGLPSDVIIPGIGEGGKRITVGIEHKKISDVLKCIVDGRFAGTQLRRMREEHDDIWLVIEGERKRGIEGELQIKTSWGRWVNASVGSRRFSYRDLESWMITMTTKNPEPYLKIKETNGRLETKEFIMSLHRWWAEKGWDNHKSNDVTDRSHMGGGGPVELIETKIQRMNREIAERLPGIGHDKAKRTVKKFKSLFEMATAEEREWKEIEGVGEKMAKRIVEAVHGYEWD